MVGIKTQKNRPFAERPFGHVSSFVGFAVATGVLSRFLRSKRFGTQILPWNAGVLLKLHQVMTCIADVPGWSGCEYDIQYCLGKLQSHRVLQKVQPLCPDKCALARDSHLW